LALANALNVDDLHLHPESSDLKVVITYPNGNVVVKSNMDSESKKVIRDVALSQWKPAVNAIFNHSLLSPELYLKFDSEVEREMREYSKSESILKLTEPDQLAVFSNRILCSEIESHCPLYSSVINIACNKKHENSEKHLLKNM